MDRSKTGLLVIDVQEKLMPSIPSGPQILWNISRLADAATILGMPIRATEQYPLGLGPTVAQLRTQLEYSEEKRMFSCRECRDTLSLLQRQNVRQILVAGVESHVCVQQTVLDLTSQGWDVFVAVDAIGSRVGIDHEIALHRMESEGAVLTTTEAAIFEWCETSQLAEFKRISQLIKQPQPE